MPEKKKIDERQYASVNDLNFKLGDEFFYPSDISQQTYNLMKERDETIAAAFDIFIGSILNMIGEYQHENEAIKEFVSRKFNLKEKGIRKSLKEIITDSMAYGYGIAEMVWTIQESVVSMKLQRIDPYARMVRFISDGAEVKAARYYNVLAQQIDIPIDKTFVHKKGVGIYGESQLRRIYRPWKFKSEMFKWFAMGSERFSTPLLAAFVMDPEAFVETNKAGWNQAIMALGTDEKLQALSPGSDMANSFIQTLDFLNKMLLRGLLIPQLILDNSNTGAFALSKTHQEIYESNVRDSAEEIAADLVDQIVTQMIQYQFGVMDNYGTFTLVDVPTVDEMNTLADIIQKVTSSGVISPAEPFVRDLFKFPEADAGYKAELERMKAEEADNNGSQQ